MTASEGRICTARHGVYCHTRRRRNEPLSRTNDITCGLLRCLVVGIIAVQWHYTTVCLIYITSYKHVSSKIITNIKFYCYRVYFYSNNNVNNNRIQNIFIIFFVPYADVHSMPTGCVIVAYYINHNIIIAIKVEQENKM